MESRSSHWIRANRRTWWLLALFSVLPLLATTAFATATWFQEPTMRTWGPVFWVFVFAGISLTMAVGLTPTTLVAIWTGYLIGWWALPGVVVSYLLAIVICAMIVRRVDGGRFYASLATYPKVRKLIGNLRAHEFWIVVLSKLSPVLPFAITNLVFLVNGVRLPVLMQASFIGMLPRTMAAVWIGGSLEQVHARDMTNFSASTWLGSGLIVLTLAGLGQILRRAWPDPDTSPVSGQ